MARRDKTPGGGLYRPDIVRAMLGGHGLLGIAFAAILYLVCLTRAISVFQQDLTLWEEPGLPQVGSVSDAAVARAVAHVAPHAGDQALYVSFPDADMPRLRLTTQHGADEHNWIADAQGKIVGEARAPWTEFLTRLHIQLHLPRSWGAFVVGLAGVALLSSLISGILSHPRVLRDAFHLRLGGARRLQEADIHNRLGVWALPFHALIALTGALLGLSTVIVGALAMLLYRGDTGKVYAMLSPPRPAVDARAAPMPDIGAMLAKARAHAPEARPRMMTITHAGRRDASVLLSAGRPGLLAAQDSYTFDAAGRIMQEKHPGGLTLGEKILGSLGPLHFGWFGGPLLRIAYGLLGVALCVVTSSGIHIWLARRRDRGSPLPHWERVWAAVLWGQPAIMALTAVVAVVAPGMVENAATGLWLGLTVISLATAGLMSRISQGAIGRSLRRVTGSLLLLVAALHMARHSALLESIPVDLALALIGGICILPWQKSDRSSATKGHRKDQAPAMEKP